MAASNSSDINTPSTSHRTIEGFGLTREPTVWEPKDTSFIDPYLLYTNINEPCSPSSTPTLPEWKSYKIMLPRPQDGLEKRNPKLLNGYAVSPSHQAYVTFCVKLLIDPTTEDEKPEEGAPQRLTPMRYRDMIADNYISAFPHSLTSTTTSTSPLSTLRWLGVANILHRGSRATFKQLFRLAGKDILARGQVEVHPEIDLNLDGGEGEMLRDLLLADPFTRGVLALLHHRGEELGFAYAKRFVFISEGYEGGGFVDDREPSSLELRLNLVVELGRSGGAGDGLKGSSLANL